MSLLQVLGLCLALSLGAAAQASNTSPIQVIANDSIQADDLPRKTLRAIFGLRMQYWPNGEAVKVYVLDNKDKTHQTFCQQVLGMLPYHLRRNWDRLVFSGTGEAPTKVSSIREMKDKVASTPGAIGYLPAEDIDESISILQISL